MKPLVIFAAFLVVLVSAAAVAVRSTADGRVETARTTLEAGAKRFVACYERERSYSKCRTGSSSIAVTYRTRNAFDLTYTADFAATLTISRKGDGALRRSCESHGQACPEGWTSSARSD